MTRHIVQCARTIEPGYGVSGPAYQLEQAFSELGCRCERFTLADLGLRTGSSQSTRQAGALLRFWRDVLLFSTLGSLQLWWWFRRRRDHRTVVLCHVDALFGDLFAVRSLHKGFLETHPQRWRMLLRNPLHAFVLTRDALRFRWPTHRHFVALSERNKAEIIRLYDVPESMITVIPNGVDLQRFRPSRSSRHSVRSALSLPTEALVGIFVGHEFRRKGLRVVLEALRRVLADGVEMFLLVAGGDSPGDLEVEFGDLANRVRYLGYRSDIERYYAAADVFVMPASFDISPLVGPEALASGLPILMTDVGGVREYLRDAENGWLVDRDPVDVAQKLTTMARDRPMRDRMSRAARPSISDRDWRLIARRFLDLLDEQFPLPPEHPDTPRAGSAV